MIANTNKDRGRVGLSLAIAYFGANGYTVSLPLNDTQWYDMIVEKDGITPGSKRGPLLVFGPGNRSADMFDIPLPEG